MSSTQFKILTTHLDVPRKVCDLYQHVIKTCPFCNSTKPRPDTSRVSGQRAEELGDLIFLDRGSAKKMEVKPLDFWSFWIVWPHTWQHIHVRVPLHQKSFPNFMSGWTHSDESKGDLCRHGFPSPSWDAGILSSAWCEEISFRSTHCLAKSSLNWCSIVWKSFSRALMDTPSKNFGQDYSVTNHTCPVDAQGGDSENTQGNSEWQNAYGAGDGRKETKRSYGPSLPWIQNSWHPPTKQDLLNEEIQKLAMKTHLEVQQREGIRRESCWRIEICSSRSKSKTKSVLIGKMIRAKFSKDENLEIEIVDVNGPHGCYQNEYLHIQVHASRLRRPLDTVDLDGTSRLMWANTSTCVMAFLWGPNGCQGWRLLYQRNCEAFGQRSK